MFLGLELGLCDKDKICINSLLRLQNMHKKRWLIYVINKYYFECVSSQILMHVSVAFWWNIGLFIRYLYPVSVRILGRLESLGNTPWGGGQSMWHRIIHILLYYWWFKLASWPNLHVFGRQPDHPEKTHIGTGRNTVHKCHSAGLNSEPTCCANHCTTVQPQKHLQCSTIVQAAFRFVRVHFSLISVLRRTTLL